MKNLIIYSGIALVVLTNIKNTSFETKKEVVTSPKNSKEVLETKGFNTEFSNSKSLSAFNNPTEFKSKTLFLRNFSKIVLSKTIVGEEPIAGNVSIEIEHLYYGWAS